MIFGIVMDSKTNHNGNIRISQNDIPSACKEENVLCQNENDTSLCNDEKDAALCNDEKVNGADRGNVMEKCEGGMGMKGNEGGKAMEKSMKSRDNGIKNNDNEMGRRDALVIIPMYKEKENAAAIIEAVLGLEHGFDVLVIDDNSPDGTADIVRGKIAEHPGRVHLVERPGKLGLGTAYITGFKWALERGYDYVFEMDADFSHNPNDLPALYAECAEKGADVAIGSRYLTGVNVVNWPMGRVLMSYFASKYVQMVTGLKIKDTTAGFACYRADVLRTMELDKIRFKGYAFQIEMKFTAVKCGFDVREVPIVFVNRVLGVSKMSSGIFGEALFGVMKLKLGSFRRKYPQKGSVRV